MIATVITPDQQKRLQTLYGQYAAREIGVGTDRPARLAWATERLRRPIASFSEITLDDARFLIDALQAVLGVKVPARKPRRRMTARDGQKAGTEGRHDQIHAEQTLVCPADIDRIQRDLDRIGWSQAQLEAWLRSPRGPNGRRAEIRTLGDANRVHWALKHIKPRTGVPHDH